jgi:hypothetical protein
MKHYIPLHIGVIRAFGCHQALYEMKVGAFLDAFRHACRGRDRLIINGFSAIFAV